MGDEDQPNLGLQVAHTRAENSGAAAIEADAARVAKVGATAATVEAAMKDLAEQLVGDEDEPEQQSLMLDEIDERQALFSGPVRHVADKIDASRRGRGRPKGSQNKASAEFRDVLMRMGYRHPGLNLAAAANADPAALAIELGSLRAPPAGMEAHDWLRVLVEIGYVDRNVAVALMVKARELIDKANAELLPYFESKVPTKIAVDKRVKGFMFIGDMTAAVQSERSTLDLTKFDEPT